VVVLAQGSETPNELPGPAPRFYTDREARQLNASCARCHERIATEWAQSGHKAAFTNAYYSRALAAENTPFCRKCHAPDADPRAQPARITAANGVSCVTCHLTRWGIAGSQGISREVVSSGAAPGHFSQGLAELRSPAVCAGCHQFDFPAASPEQASPMQDTVAEHAASKYSRVSCQSCHMPERRAEGQMPHTDHRFLMSIAGGRTAPVDVELVARQGDEVRVALTPARIGHAFPSGDLFRSAELRVSLVSHGVELDSASYIMHRAYHYDAQTQTKRVVRDTRLMPASPDGDGRRIVELALSSQPGEIRWQLVWQRMPEAVGTALGLDWRAQERVVASGIWE
jgi:hypothetical protein